MFARVVLVALLFITACSGHKQIPATQPGDALTTRFTLMDGSYHSLAELADRPILIVFWSAECSHCRSEIPEINSKLKDLMQAKRAWVLAINLDAATKLEEVQEYITLAGFDGALHGFSGNESLDETFVAFHGDETPYYVVITKDGRVTYADREFESALQAVEYIMN